MPDQMFAGMSNEDITSHTREYRLKEFDIEGSQTRPCAQHIDGPPTGFHPRPRALRSLISLCCSVTDMLGPFVRVVPSAVESRLEHMRAELNKLTTEMKKSLAIELIKIPKVRACHETIMTCIAFCFVCALLFCVPAFPVCIAIAPCQLHLCAKPHHDGSTLPLLSTPSLGCAKLKRGSLQNKVCRRPRQGTGGEDGPDDAGCCSDAASATYCTPELKVRHRRCGACACMQTSGMSDMSRATRKVALEPTCSPRLTIDLPLYTLCPACFGLPG